MSRFLFFLVALSACEAVDAVNAASCNEGDVACVINSFSPEEIKAAVWYIGPCYEMGRELCDRVETCTGALLDADSCVDWWIETVCTNPFDPDHLNMCADWAEQVECKFFEDPEGYQADHGYSFTCDDVYPHPVGGADLYEGHIPPGA